jgi:hypothetical protein
MLLRGLALGSLSGELTNIAGGVREVRNTNVAIPVTSLVPDPGSCTILSLTLGPLDLNLLGLEVQLSQVDLLIQTASKSSLPQCGNKLTVFPHIPSDLVVDQWTSDGESRSHRDFLFLYDL